VQRANPFIVPCLPTLRTEPPTGPGWLHEVKFDGYRIQLHKDGRDVALYSKNGNEFTWRFPEIVYAVAALPTTSFILDGEITACRDDGTPSFGALLQKQEAHLCVWVFDILSQYGKDVRALPLVARRAKLHKLMTRVQSNQVRCSETFQDPRRLLAACQERRMEGIVSKRVDSPYVSGPSKRWIKVKCPDWREANAWRHEFFEKRK
jgi:bifunctional non-homologous end joining protein LigD